MTRSIAGAGMTASSPHSLGDASRHDTPSTNLTAFSPEDVVDFNEGRFKVSITPAHEDDTIGSEDGKAS